jgi:hypothetical protein
MTISGAVITAMPWGSWSPETEIESWRLASEPKPTSMKAGKSAGRHVIQLVHENAALLPDRRSLTDQPERYLGRNLLGHYHLVKIDVEDVPLNKVPLDLARQGENRLFVTHLQPNQGITARLRQRLVYGLSLNLNGCGLNLAAVQDGRHVPVGSQPLDVLPDCVPKLGLQLDLFHMKFTPLRCGRLANKRGTGTGPRRPSSVTRHVILTEFRGFVKHGRPLRWPASTSGCTPLPYGSC